MTTALTTLANVELFTGADASEATLLNLLITQVSALIEEQLDRTFALATYLEYYSGEGTGELVLRQRPVQLVQTTGTTTSGSVTVSGIPSTSRIVVGMPCVGTGIPSGATVASVSTGSVTLSAQATASGTGVPLNFGLAIWLDDNGFWGQGSGSFPAATLLTPGTDYALRVDDSGLASRSGLVLRIGATWRRPQYRSPGLLSAYPGPASGNVQVNYTAGYATVPSDVELAALSVIAKVRNARVYGDAITSEAYESYSISFADQARGAWLGYLSGPGAALVARYRNLSL